MPYPRPKIIELCGNDVGDNEAALVKVAEVPIDRPLFEPLLSEIVLQGYEAFKVYEVVVRFRNNDKVRGERSWYKPSVFVYIYVYVVLFCSFFLIS